MNISITSRKFKARQSLKDYIQAELDNLNKLNDRIMNADVILSFQNKNNSIKIAEIILQVPGHTLAATEETDEFEKSVSAATDKLLRQLEKLKTKRQAVRVK